MYKTVKELATELAVSRTTVWKWAKQLEIGGYSSQYDARERLFDEQQQQQIREVVLRQKHIPKAD